MTADFTAQVAPAGMVMDKVDAHNTYRFPMDHPMIRTLRGVYEELTGKLDGFSLKLEPEVDPVWFAKRVAKE